MARKQSTGTGTAGVEVITNSIPHRRRVMKRGQKASGCWQESPAVIKFFVAALWLLEELARDRGVDLGSASQVTMLRAARVKGKDEVYLYPTNWDDPLGIALKRAKERTTANLYDFMAEAGWLVEVNHAERFALTVAEEGSPVGPALVFDRSKVLERKYMPPTKRKTKAEREASKNNKPTGADKSAGKVDKPTAPSAEKTAATTDPAPSAAPEAESK